MPAIIHKKKTNTDTSSALLHGELGFTQNYLWYGNQAGAAIRIARHTDIPTNLNQLTNGPGYITGINSSMVTTALGYTPYNNSNPSGYISGINSSMIAAALGYTPASAGDLSSKLNLSGGTMTGILYPQQNTSYGTGQARRIVISTSDPVGGGNGDVWIKYIP